MNAPYRRLATTCSSLPLALLAACGGGGSSTTTPAEPPTVSGSACTDPPEAKLTTLANGVFVGGISGSAEERFVLLTRDGSDMAFAGPYGRLIRLNWLGAAAHPIGVTVFAPEFGCSPTDRQSSNGRDVAGGSQDVANGQRVVIGMTSYIPSSATVAGTVRPLAAGSRTQAFSSSSGSGFLYQPLTTPKLADVAGAWALTDAAGRPGGLSVAGDGTVTGTLQGCAVAGTFAPVDGGLNAFSANLTASGCATGMAGPTGFAGLGLVLPLAAGGAQLVLWAEANNGVDARYLLATGWR